MKTYLIFAFIILMNFTLYGQTDTISAEKDVIILKKELHKIKYGQNIILVISDVNPFISKSFVEYKPVNFNFSTEEFEKMNINNQSQKIEDSVKAKVAEISGNNKLTGFLNDYSEKYKKLNFTYKAISSYSENNESFQNNDFIKEKIDSLHAKLKEQKDEISELIDSLKNLKEINNNQKEEILKLTEVTSAKNEFMIDFKSFQEAFNKINNYSIINTILSDQIKTSNIFIENSEDFKNKAKSTFSSLSDGDELFTKKDIKVQLENLETLYSRLNSNYQKINELLKKKKFEFSGELKDGQNSMKIEKMIANIEVKYFFEEEMKKVKTINDSLSLPKNKFLIISETQKGCDLFSEIQSHDYKTIISSPFIYDDKADITFQLKNEKNEVLFSYPTLKVKTYNQLKINGSAGYFLNFIGDEKYETFKKEGQNHTYLRASNSDKIKHSLGGLLHAYYTFHSDFAVGLSTGLSINDDADASFYMGGSLFFTENNRLVITSGISFVKIDQLKKINLLQDLEEDYYFDTEEYQLEYDKVYNPSFFIGVTYNLSK